MYIVFDSGLARENGVDLSCRVCSFDFAIDFLCLEHGDIVRCPNCKSSAITKADSALFDPEEMLPEKQTQRPGSAITVL